jgi:hypothetical protein
MSAALVVFLTASAITVVPRAEGGMSKFLAVTLTIALYFCVIGLRTSVIVHQLSLDRPQTFDRPAPESITVAFLVLAAVAAFWPHSL